MGVIGAIVLGVVNASYTREQARSNAQQVQLLSDQVRAGDEQFQKVRRSEDLKQFREILADHNTNPAAWQTLLQDDAKAIGDNFNNSMHYERLVALVPDIKDQLSVTDCRQMAFFAASIKGRKVALEYLKMGERKLAENYDPVDAANLFNAHGLILAVDFPATSADDIIKAHRKAVEHAEKIDESALRRATLAQMRYGWAIDCYVMGRFEDGDEQMKLAAATHRFACQDSAANHAVVEYKLSELKLHYGQEPGRTSQEPMMVERLGRVRLPDGTLQFRARVRPTREVEREFEREQNELDKKADEERAVRKALKSLF